MTFQPKRTHRAGFSLIELLVVMVIAVVIASGVRLAVGGQSSTVKKINQQGSRLYAQMQYALDEALMRNTPLGIDVEGSEEDLSKSTRYSWLQYNYELEAWEQTEEPLGQQNLEEGIAWQIEFEDSSLEEVLDDLLNDEEQKLTPEIIFYPSGEVSYFVMNILLSEEALEDQPDAIDQRYKILLNQRGQLARFHVDEIDPDE